MNSMRKLFVGVFFVFLVLGTIALADGSAAIMETYTGDSQISVYIKGIESGMDNATVQIATTEAEKFDTKTLSEMDKPMQTLVMVDNSISISTENREKITQFLQNLIADRLNNEELSIATFSEDINIIADYSNDYTVLKQAIDSISYQDQETYLTDVLYDLISEKYMQNDEEVYRRIIVVSDGVDNKPLGNTKDELYSLLTDVKIPIYTIGSVNKNNNDDLENMFALSRKTSADYFLLDDVDDLFEIAESLKEDRNIVKLTIIPSDEIMDGSKKTVRITLEDGTSLVTEMPMPQKTIDTGLAKDDINPGPDLNNDDNDDSDSDGDEEIPESTSNYLIIIIAVIIVVIVIGVILVLVRKKKSQDTRFETIDDDIYQKLQQINNNTDEETVIISASNQDDGSDGNTVVILSENAAYQVTLTDINSPAKSFSAPLNNSIIIGRSKKSVNINLDIDLRYDNSVSGPHCEITARNEKFYINDLNSSNGTYVNGSKVLTEVEIFSGNILKLGRLEMRFEVR